MTFEQAVPRDIVDFERNPFELFEQFVFRRPRAFAQRDEQMEIQRTEERRFAAIRMIFSGKTNFFTRLQTRSTVQQKS